MAQLAAANRWGATLLWCQAALALGLATLIDWQRAREEPLSTSFAIAAVVGPFAFSILRHMAQQKKEIGQLKEQTRFGAFDKFRLKELYRDTLQRLQLPDDRLPVYILADKFMNASMLHVGLGWIFRSLNGIYLHRQALHKLSPEEVQDIMGHELGHYYHYYLVTDRFRFVPLALAALAALYVVQVFGLNSVVSMFVILLASGLVWKINSLLNARYIWGIEYLCDDLGAHVHGVPVSITGLMKIGAEWEVLTAIQLQAASSAHRGQLNAQEISEAIEAAVPYGHASRAELELAVQQSLKRKASQGPSVGGFLRYMWQSDLHAEQDEELERQMKQLAALQSVPRIPWEKLLEISGEIKFNERSLRALVELIERFPQAELFHTPEALGAYDPLHPPLKRRILYLWYNRAAIERPRVAH